MRKLHLHSTIGLILGGIILVFSCAPVALPSPAPAPLPNQPLSTPMAIPKSLATLSPGEVAWQKVVEAAKKEGKVNAYAFTWVGDIGLAVAKAFKEKYGISVEIVTGRGAEFLERMKMEKRTGRQVGDITEGAALHINNMKLEGLLTSVAAELPSLQERGVWLVEPTANDPRDKIRLAWRINTSTPYINTKLVKPEELLQSWKDLLGPRWKGKMGLGEPNIGGSVYQTIVVLMDNRVWDEEYMRSLYRQNLRFFSGDAEELLALARGEIHLSIRVVDGTAARFVQEGAPIQAIDMKEGVVVTTGSVGAIARAPNPNAARVFLNWIFSQEGQTVTGRAQGNKMVRKDVPDFRPNGVQTPLTNPLVTDLEQLERATQLFREKWFDKVVGR